MLLPGFKSSSCILNQLKQQLSLWPRCFQCRQNLGVGLNAMWMVLYLWWDLMLPREAVGRAMPPRGGSSLLWLDNSAEATLVSADTNVLMWPPLHRGLCVLLGAADYM